MSKFSGSNKSDQEFHKWNPMEDDYKNKNFNAFVQGPGADLDEDLQPGVLANQSQQQQKNSTEGRYRLVLKHIPKEMTRKALKKLCSNYGKVLQIWENPKTPVKFVTFATLNDMMSALNKLKDNPYKMIVEIAKERKIAKESEAGNMNSSNMLLASVSNGKENTAPSKQQHQYPKLDMNRRSIKGPFTRPPRVIRIEKEPFVTEIDYENSNLIKTDPKKFFLIEYDMHYQDRNNKNVNDDKYGKLIHTGRSYYVESKEIMANLKKMSKSSIGQYNSTENCYKKMSSKGSSDEFKPKKCSYCAKYASKACGGCNEYYCSAECQRTDWPRHRNHCSMGNTEKSTLQKIDQILNKTIQKQNNNKTETSSSEYSIKMIELPKSGSHIAVTTVSKPNRFYIRSMDSNDNVEYVKILNAVNGYATKSPTLQKLPATGDICIADFQNTGYYRALVLKPISVNKIIVVYIDFGNVEEKQLSELKEAPIEVRNLKCYTIPVRLKNIPDFIPTQKLKDYLNSYVDNFDVDLKLIYNDDDYNRNSSGGGGVQVEIFDATNNTSLNKKILEMREIQEPTNSDAPIYKVDIEHKLLPTGRNIEVYVLDNSLLPLGYISCILPKDMIPLQELTIQLKEYAEKVDGPYTPRQSELCVVQYDDNEWYRAECLEVVGDENPTVLFIDYGNMSPVHISKIRKYPKELKYHPCTTTPCLIADFPEDIDAKLAVRLRELIPMNNMLTITEISSEKMDDETNIIFLPEIVKILKP